MVPIAPKGIRTKWRIASVESSTQCIELASCRQIILSEEGLTHDFPCQSRVYRNVKFDVNGIITCMYNTYHVCPLSLKEDSGS